MAVGVFEVVYNSDCPVCAAGIKEYRRLCAKDARAGETLWCDVTLNPGALAEYGIDINDIRLKLHVIDRQGNVLYGMPAVAAVWSQTPGRRWLARLVQMPILRAVGAMGYHLVAHGLYRWNKALGHF